MRPPLVYPPRAQLLAIEGVVVVRGLLGGDGLFVSREVEACACWAEASPEERQATWHPELCLETSPESHPELRQGALNLMAKTVYNRPTRDGLPTEVPVVMPWVFRLD